MSTHRNIVYGCAPLPDFFQESEEETMQVIHPRCAGLDVHQKTVVVTAMITQQDGTVQRDRQTFSTMTADLLVLDEREPAVVGACQRLRHARSQRPQPQPRPAGVRGRKDHLQAVRRDG